jgi:hypothetical protein
MKIHGIEFQNRFKKSEGGDITEIVVGFIMFSALCESFGLSRHILGVEYSSNFDGYSINVDPSLEFSEVGGGIEYCADRTLSQYEIFGRIEHRYSLED